MNVLKTKPKIFIADLAHNQFFYQYGVPLNCACLAAHLKGEFQDRVDVRIFKFPDVLIRALNEKPDILALSNYDWNINLNRCIVDIARQKNPDIFIVMGGPNIRTQPEGVKAFLKANTFVDAYVLFEGEAAFAGIVKHFLSYEGLLRDTLVNKQLQLPQVAYLSDHSLIMGDLCPSIFMKDIPYPSAWLSGYLDDFLNYKDFLLMPIVETTRGCPYECTFCTGYGGYATGLKQVRQFNIDVVFEELDYIFHKAEKDFYLLIADANLGILKRDIEIVERVRKLSDQYGKVVSVFVATSKGNIERDLELYKILGDLSMPVFAQQTFNKDICKNVKRINVSFEKTKALVDEVHANGAKISTDLLLGLPGETRDAHVGSVRTAFDAGFDRFQIADIRLLTGTEMEADASRKKYGIQTKSRIIPNAFGVYGDKRIIEYEHCIRKTNTMTEEDFLELRLFHGNVFVMMNLDMARPLFTFAQNHGLHPVDLIASVTNMPLEKDFPLLFKQYDEYIKYSKSEWFDSSEEADQYYLTDSRFDEVLKGGTVKLNYDYASNLIVNKELLKEFFDWIGLNIKKQLPDVDSFSVDKIVKFSRERIISYPIYADEMVSLSLGRELFYEISKHIEPYQKKAMLTDEVEVQLIIDQDQKAKIERLIKNNLSKLGVKHAVQTVVQYHNKLFLKQSKVQQNSFIVNAGE